MTTQRLSAILMLAALAACGSVPKRTFQFQTIDTNEQPLSCLVVVGDDWDRAAERGQVTTDKEPLRVEIVFDQPSVDVTVMQVAVGDDGKMLAPPRSRSSPSDYRTQVRPLGPNDPPDQLFILERR
jgi:hypothetical protein